MRGGKIKNDINNTPFEEDDIFCGQETRTPGLDSVKTFGTNKLLVVLFLVDCSRSMEGERIMAVNAALAEIKFMLQDLKNDNGLDLKIAIMSFTSSAKWEVQLTDIDEVSLENLKTRPGLTEYGNAFHELNKVLSEERFMKHTGKIAHPSIVFLTDGGPTDKYDSDLEELLKNQWFAGASREVILLGDAIDDVAAKNAVKKFVEDPENEIIGTDKSHEIIQKIKTATMHAVVDEPKEKERFAGQKTETGGYDPFKVDPTDPFGNVESIFGEDITENGEFGEDTDGYDPFKGEEFF